MGSGDPKPSKLFPDELAARKGLPFLPFGGEMAAAMLLISRLAGVLANACA
jgi:hypothetical protein